MNKITLMAIFRGSIGMAVAIALGAFAAHYLKTRLDESHRAIFETAVKYQIYGCLGLVLMGLLNHLGVRDLRHPIALLRIGILIFCGTLYFLALKPLGGIAGMGWVGAITPLGGLSMIAAWIWVGGMFLQSAKNTGSSTES